MITYGGLARVVSVVAGGIAATLPPGHAAQRALALALRELRSLDADTPVTGTPTIRRAFGFGQRGLWLHRCGNVSLGKPVTDVPPGYCEQCTQSGGWERLYVNVTQHAE